MERKKLRRLFIILVISYIVVLTVNITVNYEYYRSGHGWTSSVGFCIAITTVGFLGFIIGPEPLIRRAVNWKKRPTLGLALALGISGLYGVVLLLVFMKVMVLLSLWSAQPASAYINNSLYAALLCMLIGLLVTGYEFLVRWRKSTEDNERMKAEMIRSQYEALKNQVNPHFLFNTLNTLAAIIPVKPDIAVDFVQQLARVFRYSLQDTEENTVSIAEEMKIVTSFLFLNAQRFDGKLHTDVRIDAGFPDRRVVTQSILMLVENAIKHNEISAQNPLYIRIYTDNDTLVVQNSMRTKLIPEPSTGIGLQNISKRYALITARPVQITLENNNFIVKIPVL